MFVDLGNKRDITDYVLHAHRRPWSNADASMSVDGSGSGGYETAGSEVLPATEDEVEDVVFLTEDYIGWNNRK